MNFSLFTYMFTFAFIRQISPLPLACSYNGTTHAEGDFVRTEEPCLSCVCRKGALACSLRVCADLPDNLPPACFVVHKPRDCCPQIFCEEGFTQDGIELRTVFKMADKLTGNDCLINGSTYAEGSAIASTQKCEYCYCIQGHTKCVKPRCYQPFEGCKVTYQQSSCCPTYYDCRNADADALDSGMKNFAKEHSKVPINSLRSLSNLESDTEEPPEETTAEESTTTTTTTTMETATEVTTMETEAPTTTAEETTFFSFQTMKSENLVMESTPALVEETTPEPESESKDVEIRSKVDFDDVVQGNSSLGDDYDAYDYSEPKLPPSLPNLVIFPFVAADAVVKDETSEHPGNSDIKRIDTHPIFYKDYFTPPVKTEGGFIPKEPSRTDLVFYEYPYIRKEQVDLQESKPEAFPDTSNQKAVSIAEVTPDPYEEILPVGKDDPPKKPVTVAYKNIVVDYYPGQLITTRGRYKSTTEVYLSAEGSADTPSSEISQTTIVIPAEETFFGIPDKTEPPTTDKSFFDDFLKSFLLEETTTAVAPTTKHKYSSKIKSSTDKSKDPRKPIKKEGVKRYTKSTTSTTTESYVGSREAVEKVEETGNQSENGGSVGALLKLAGCNIYGRMYRVGKVIVELSGPCLECVCTDLGVQCGALEC